MLKDRAVAGDQPLVSLLPLSRVPEQGGVELVPTVVDVAMLGASLRVREDQDVWRRAARRDSPLATAAILVVQFGPANCVAWFQCPRVACLCQRYLLRPDI